MPSVPMLELTFNVFISISISSGVTIISGSTESEFSWGAGFIGVADSKTLLNDLLNWHAIKYGSSVSMPFSVGPLLVYQLYGALSRNKITLG